MQDLISLYTNKISQYAKEIQKVKKQLFYTAAARLITFILLIAFMYAYLKASNSLYIILCLLSLVSFLWLVKKSNTLIDRRKLLENLYFINTNELDILNGGKNKFNNGNAFLTNESYYADLDIFGEKSLFHLLNRTSTQQGFEALAQLLKQPYLSSSVINEQQEAIKTFSPQVEVRENIIARALINKEATGNIDEVYSWLQQPVVLLLNKYIAVIRFLLPLLNLTALYTYLNSDDYSFLIVTIFLSWVHVGMFTKYINTQHLVIGRKQQMLNQFADILKEFENTETGSSVVLLQNKKLSTEAHVEIKKLSQLSSLLDSRLNVLVNILLNSFLLYDIHCMISLEKWKRKNKDKLAAWIECAAAIETLTSLAAFAFNHPSYCYPTIVTGDLLIEATNLAHPLIKEGESVSNNIKLGSTSKLWIVTGSNMSGKTTFLRTVGINTLLAQCGIPVCATSFSFTPLTIYTSIRISDSLQEHTSYFMAELKRLSEIKDSIAAGNSSLVLIDEILRGTNSEDKYYGSAEFVKKLIQFNCLTLFATHDLKLSELENQYPGLIENYCFESVIEDDELEFDYRILKGVAQNKNASFLMKKMKII